MVEAPRPAFYALARGGWRDYVTLLHGPYTLWHLSYVALGAALADRIDFARLGATLAAFALALGVAAHALDELRDRPLGTSIPRTVLVALAAASLAGSVAIGVISCFWISPWLAPFIALGAVLVVGYNLELLGLHGDVQFALAWGAFPVLTGAFAQTETVRLDALLAAAAATLVSLAQRRLSTPIRHVRRRAASVTGTVELADGTREPIGALTLIAPGEAALRLLSVAMPLLAAGLVVARL